MFLDFIAAFDSVTRQKLWKILENDGMPLKFVELMKAYCDASVSRVRNRNELFEEGVDLPKQPDKSVCEISAEKGCPGSESTIQKNEKVVSRNERFEEGVDLPKQPDEGVCDIAVKKGCPDSESTIQKNEKVEFRNAVQQIKNQDIRAPASGKYFANPSSNENVWKWCPNL
ncbi:hypothetical protein QYM36_013177 [Artemia franciscana]|uniref:Reverse transcriptase domain-containing protein n=1 Tax=Artemia franciscana TaxID=6661 RepID=A0AA88KYI0_ARTSF|nr:hypothetical protein QYM36_013177 [Artemia franciscana]